MGPTAQSVSQFFAWLKSRYPDFYARVKVSGAPLGAIDWNALLDNVKNTATAVLTYQQNRDLIKLNLERARQGLAPLDSAAYAPAINAGIGDSTQGAITKWLLIGGAVLLAFAFIRR